MAVKSALRKLRESAGLTQDELAALAGMNQGHLARLEQGAADNPTLDTLERLARGLGVKLTTIVDAIRE